MSALHKCVEALEAYNAMLEVIQASEPNDSTVPFARAERLFQKLREEALAAAYAEIDARAADDIDCGRIDDAVSEERLATVTSLRELARGFKEMGPGYGIAVAILENEASIIERGVHRMQDQEG